MHFYRKCWFDPFEEQFISPLSRLPVTNAWNCHSYTAFSSNVGAWGMWACSLFLSQEFVISQSTCMQTTKTNISLEWYHSIVYEQTVYRNNCYVLKPMIRSFSNLILVQISAFYFNDVSQAMILNAPDIKIYIQIWIYKQKIYIHAYIPQPITQLW